MRHSAILDRLRSLTAAIALLTVTTAGLCHASDLDRMRLAASYLKGAQLASGLFAFDMDFVAGQGRAIGTTPGARAAYITREASAAFGLAKYFDYSADVSLTDTIAKSIEALGASSVPVGGTRSLGLIEKTGLLSIPVGRITLARSLDALGLLYRKTGSGRLLAADGNYKTAWLGGTAVAMLAELYFYRATGDPRFAALRSSWYDGLAALYIPGRGFREFPSSIDENPLADAEVWLALSYYADTFPSRPDRLLRQLDEYMTRTYTAKPSLDVFHWGSMAAALRLKTTADRRFSLFLTAQAAFALRIPDDDDNNCSVVEGLAAIRGALRSTGGSDRDLLQRIDNRIEREMSKSRSLQIEPGQQRVDYPAGTSLLSPRLQSYAGAFLVGRYEPYTRIDMTVHCLSAMVELHPRAMHRPAAAR